MTAPAIRELPDVETVVVDYLKAHPALRGLVDRRNIAAELPGKSTEPALTVFIAPSPPATERHLAAAVVQIDAWGGKREEARTLASVAHAALVEMVGTQRSGAVVTGVETLLAPGKFPEPSRPRYMFQVRVWAHP